MPQTFRSYRFLAMKSLKYVLNHPLPLRVTANPSQVIPASYQNEARRIPIPNLPEEIIPASPEDIKIPVPPSGYTTPKAGLGSPVTGLSTPQSGFRTPHEPERLTQQHVEDVV